MYKIGCTDQISGPSSNIAFMRHISRAIARGSTDDPSVPSLSSPSHTGGGMLTVSRSHPSQDDLQGRMQTLSKSEINMFALPSEERTWSLIQIYFEKTGQLLPFIHEASFCETYFQMRENNFKRVRRTWLGLLNIVLAIATSLHTEGDMPAGKRIQESDIYFQRANGLCDRDSKRNASLEMGTWSLTWAVTTCTDSAGNSSIPFDPGSISSRNTKVCTGMDHPRARHLGCFPARSALTRGEPALFSIGE